MSNLFKDEVILEMLCMYPKFEELLDAFIDLHKNETYDNEDEARDKRVELNEFCEITLEQFKQDFME